MNYFPNAFRLVSASNLNPEKGSLTLETVGIVRNGSNVSALNGNMTFTPSAGATGIAQIEYVIEDATGIQATETISVVLSTLEVNQAPSISPIADVLNFAQPDFALQVTASDPDFPANQLRFALDEAPPGATIDSESGAIQWAPTSSGAYPFTVRVDDQGIPNLSDSESFSVTVTNAAPTIADQTFALAENSPIGVEIGTAAASDGDGDAISFVIIGGNADGAVAIDPGSGLITIASAVPLDFETNSPISLTIEAKDDATPPLARSATVTLNLTNVNEPPSVPDQSFVVTDGTVFGANVGTVAASDQDEGETLSYSITSGNEAGVFAIDPLTGTLRIIAQATVTNTIGLTVSVYDSGTPPLSDSGLVSLVIESGSGTIGVTTFAELKTGSASAVSTSGALLQGDLVFNGGEDPEIFAVWGTSDGGTDLTQWDFASSAGIVPEGEFSVPVSGFLADTEYFFRFYAANSAGISWSAGGGSFTANSVQLTDSLIAAGADARILIRPMTPTPLHGGARTTTTPRDPGPTGIGYETSTGYQPLIATDIEAAMFNQRPTVYIRLPFDLIDPASLSSLTLRMKYDDAFVAFINGTEIARSENAPTVLSWNSQATGSHSDAAAIVFEDIDVLAAAADSLVNGENLLAIHGLNAGISSSDLLFVPELTATFPEPSYAGWVGTFPQLVGADRLPDSDPDHDELSNFFEWATGSNPTISEIDSPGQSPPTTVELRRAQSEEADEHIEFRFRRRIDYLARGLHYDILATTDLREADWNALPTEMLDPPVPSGDGITEIISAQILIDPSGGIEPSPRQQFFRLIILRD